MYELHELQQSFCARFPDALVRLVHFGRNSGRPSACPRQNQYHVTVACFYIFDRVVSKQWLQLLLYHSKTATTLLVPCREALLLATYEYLASYIASWLVATTT